uniref:Uncharacterized protein MANES_18G062400 n=1 Tax=Rhizophora mucronata TaxID=61149 RepID=A0A2P2Q2T3_RHIMU
MAIGSLLPSLRSWRLQLGGTTNHWRLLSSRASQIDASDETPLRKCTKTSGSKRKSSSSSRLTTEILRGRYGGRSPSTALQNWVDEGRGKLSISQLRDIAKRLVVSRRYQHALEAVTWMGDRQKFHMLPADHAMRMELIIKVHGLREAEDYFKLLSDYASQKAASLSLLRGYVKERDTRNAEAYMMNLKDLGLLVSPHLYNEMMKLYVATSQYDKVPLVILQMKQNQIPRNVLSYNLWMSANGELSGVSKAEMVYKEMKDDKNVEMGWSTPSTLANIYMKAGIDDKAISALKVAEKKLSSHSYVGYFFLITQYCSLKNKEGVLRIWEASKVVTGRMTCANYIRILSCLVKLDDLAEAERVFLEWESNCQTYDIRVSNVLLGAYMRNGLIDKAETFHLHTLERGGSPNYKTWEILMEGWVKSQKMDKAIDAMKKGFGMLHDCHWRPSHGILLAIAEYLEKHEKFEDANDYLIVLHNLDIATLPLYKVLLRMHLNAGRSISDIFKMMESKYIEMDEETHALVQAVGS